MRYAVLVMTCLIFTLSGQDTKKANGITEQQQKGTIKNMQLISDLLIVYAGLHEDRFPEQPGVAGLEKIRSALRDSFFVAPYDTVSVASANDKPLTAKNTSYAYIGSGLSMGKGYDNGRISTPILIEKPWLRNDGKITVVDMGGRIEVKQLAAANCLEAVYKLREKNYPDDPYWKKLIANAKEVDKANGIKYD